LALTPVRVSRSFKRKLAKKTPQLQAAIATAVRQLRVDWRHTSLHAHKMGGEKDVFEARIDQANRITFHWEGDVIVLRAHCNHDILKRNP